jgi:Lrp/AsnC family transcriptional regulator, leucine-responsive regulatory protein
MTVETDAIDDVDRTIIGMLVQNGRASYTELGRAAGLSPHATADRVRRLQVAGVITGFTARVNLAGVGRGLDALIDVRLLPSTDPSAFEAAAARLDSVREVAFVTGRSDYHVRVSCRDADDLNETIRSLRQRAGAAVTETRIVMRSETYPGALGNG